MSEITALSALLDPRPGSPPGAAVGRLQGGRAVSAQLPQIPQNAFSSPGEISAAGRRCHSRESATRRGQFTRPLRAILTVLVLSFVTGLDWAAETPKSKPAEARDEWSFQPIGPATPPRTAAAGAGNPIDAFIDAQLAIQGLHRSPPADARSLCRRLYFDLIGLPPSPEQSDTFVAAYTRGAAAAVALLVDQLLASPHYGERWARHWLDVVHYGDTHGYDKDKPRPYAWPYRDYVIRAFNDDKPYARFVQEQIAGDVLYPGERDGVEALGFIAAGPWDFIGHAELPESKTDGKIARHLDRDDMVANTMGTFASVTVHCAQCHQHKFDPISQEDYYSLQAVFAAVDRTERKYYSDPGLTRRSDALEARERILKQRKDALESAARIAGGDDLKRLDAEIAEAEKHPGGNNLVDGRVPELMKAGSVAGLKQRRADLIAAGMSPADRSSYAATTNEWAGVKSELGAFPKPIYVYAGSVHSGSGNFVGTGSAGGRPRPIFLLARGQVMQPGREVGPGALSALDFRSARFALPEPATEGDRRAALSMWLVDPANPLTWRSIVNRVWQYHFGRGLVATPNDFGRMGARPSHPQLLDWLAAGFRDGGGSLKQLHRLLVTSATYQQAVVNDAKAETVDADNALLWRQNRRKLEAEALRDAVLQVSGQLDLTPGGPGWQDFVIEHPEHSPHYEYGLSDPEDRRTWRRSIYRFIVRSQTQPWMTVLDCADPSIRVERRNESQSALQALALLNNGFMVSQSRHFAERVQRERSGLAEQVRYAHRLAIGRPPAETELRPLLAFAQTHGLPQLCRVLFNLSEFAFVD